jgi:hypothetical protein
MLEVTFEELKELKELNSWISLGQYDIENHMKDKGIIGYIAGDIGTLKLSDEEDKITDDSVHDCWFINKDFFDENYEEISDRSVPYGVFLDEQEKGYK